MHLLTYLEDDTEGAISYDSVRVVRAIGLKNGSHGQVNSSEFKQQVQLDNIKPG